MSDADVAPDVTLVPEFAPPAREAWLALVAKVLKGGDFEKRLVARTADGLPVQPLYTRGDAVEGGHGDGAHARTSPAAGTSASAMPSRMPVPPTRPSSKTSRAG